ncbi:MAG: MFS transporter, partial [Elusimicrobiaceae bacterium]|nr:MFS transporter [Elusimicrobiaceae bacterium]
KASQSVSKAGEYLKILQEYSAGRGLLAGSFGITGILNEYHGGPSAGRELSSLEKENIRRAQTAAEQAREAQKQDKVIAKVEAKIKTDQAKKAKEKAAKEKEEAQALAEKEAELKDEETRKLIYEIKYNIDEAKQAIKEASPKYQQKVAKRLARAAKRDALKQKIQATSVFKFKEKLATKIDAKEAAKTAAEAKKIAALKEEALKLASQLESFGDFKNLEGQSKRLPYVYEIEYQYLDENKEIQTIKTFAVSEKKIFILPESKLVIDKDGNLVIVNSDKSIEYVFNKKIHLQEAVINGVSQPIVVLQAIPNLKSAVLSTFILTGYSSLGRFTKDPLKDTFGSSLGKNAESTATGVATSVYLLNLAALPLDFMSKKFGEKSVLALSVGLITTGLLLGASTAINFSPNLARFIALATGAVLIGIGAAGIQKTGNPLASKLIKGDDYKALTSNSQMVKSIGSLLTYIAFFIPIVLLSPGHLYATKTQLVGWTSMYALLTIPALVSVAMLLRSSKYLPLSTRKSIKEAQEKAKQAASAKTDQKITEDNQEAATQEEVSTPKQQIKKHSVFSDVGKLFINPKVWPIFLAVALVCGTDTTISNVTKSIISIITKNNFPTLSESYPLTMLITGFIILGVTIIARATNTKIQSKYLENNKLMFISAALAIGGASLLYAGHQLNLPLWVSFLSFILLNGGIANFFSLTFNNIKDEAKKMNLAAPENQAAYQEAKEKGLKNPNLVKDYETSAGTISTVALMACFLMPYVLSLIFPEAKAVDYPNLSAEELAAMNQDIVYNKVLVGIGALIGAVLLNSKLFFNKKTLPFSKWKKKAKEETKGKNKTKEKQPLTKEEEEFLYQTIVELSKNLADNSSEVNNARELASVYKKHLKGDIKGAISEYDKVIAQNPDKDVYYFGRAILKDYYLKDYESAIEDYKKALELNPNNEIYKTALKDAEINLEAEELKERNKTFAEVDEKSLADYDDSLLVYADDLRMYFNEQDQAWHYGYEQRLKDQNQEAAKEIEPNYYSQAVFYFDKGNYQEALEALNKEIAKNDSPYYVYTLRGQV